MLAHLVPVEIPPIRKFQPEMQILPVPLRDAQGQRQDDSACVGFEARRVTADSVETHRFIHMGGSKTHA